MFYPYNSKKKFFFFSPITTGRVPHQPRHSAEPDEAGGGEGGVGVGSVAPAPPLLRPQEARLPHRPLLWRRRVGRAKDLLPDGRQVVRLPLKKKKKKKKKKLARIGQCSRGVKCRQQQASKRSSFVM